MPELFLPDDRPPRLNEAAKTSIRKLAGYMDQLKFNLDEASQEYDTALQAAGAEPEPRLLYGLVLLKKRDREQGPPALRSRQRRTAQPAPALRGAGMVEDGQAGLPGGHSRTDQMISKIPKPAGPVRPRAVRPNPSNGRGNSAIMPREVGDPSRQLTEEIAALDAAVAARGPQAVALYDKGRQLSAGILADFDKKIEQSTEDAEKGTLTVNRKLLANYSDFPLNPYKDQVLAHLDE